MYTYALRIQHTFNTYVLGTHCFYVLETQMQYIVVIHTSTQIYVQNIDTFAMSFNNYVLETHL